jgi:NADH dehydrogenase/NADH:ubiquinone oxidoreductase subunit G
VESIDLTDGEGANLRLQLRGNTILRVLPFVNHRINGEWISDRARFAYDALTHRRIEFPRLDLAANYLFGSPISLRLRRFAADASGSVVRPPEGGLPVRLGWEAVFRWFRTAFSGQAAAVRHNFFALLSPSVDSETAYQIKSTFSRLGSSHLILSDLERTFLSLPNAAQYVQAGAFSHSGSSASTSTGLATALQTADAYLCIGADLRFEAPTQFALLRKELIRHPGKKLFLVASTGCGLNFQAQTVNLGASLPRLLRDLTLGRHAVFRRFAELRSPLVFVGRTALRAFRASPSMLRALFKLQSYWLGRAAVAEFHVLRAGANSWFQEVVGAQGRCDDPLVDAGYWLKTPSLAPKVRNVLFSFGEDRLGYIARSYFDFVVYQSANLPSRVAATQFDLALPAAAFSEFSADYYNLLGMKQKTYLAVNAAGQVAGRAPSQIVRALADLLLPFANGGQSSARLEYKDLELVEPLLCGRTVESLSVTRAVYDQVQALSNFYPASSAVSLPLSNQNFYASSDYVGNSATMALRARLQRNKFTNFAGTR